MNRGNSTRQPNVVLNTSRSQPRDAASSFAAPNISDVQHHKNKSGLPYIPSTPSTRSSHSGTSFGSLRSNSFDEKDVVEYETEQYDYGVVKQRPPQKSWKEGGKDNNRGRSESPIKRNDRSGHKGTYQNTTDSRMISASDYSRNNTAEFQQSQQPPAFYVPSRSHHSNTTSSNSPKLMSSNASQSTSSTSSSRRQLIPNIKSSSSISTFGSAGASGNHRQTSQQQHPDSVQEEQTVDYNENEDEESSLDEVEEDTVHTKPMIRYKSATKVHERGNANSLHPTSKIPVQEDDDEDASPFFNESFDTVDFGSTTGVAPAIPALSMVVPKQLQSMNTQPEPHYHTHDDLEYGDEQYYENEDDGAYYEDQELLYENSNDNYLPPEYDDEEYYEEGEEYYDDEVDVDAAEEELLQRAVRRGSALAYTGGGYSTGINQNHSQYVAERKQSARPLSMRSETMNTNTNPPIQQRQPQQPALTAARRPQISRSMASKRHLIAASARGVVPTRVTSNSAQMDTDILPVLSKQRSIENGIQQQQQQQRQRVMKASSYGDIERPPPQQPRRGSVTKAASHNTSLQNPPRTRTHPTRMSSNRGIGDLSLSESPQTAMQQPSVRRTTSSRRSNFTEEEMQRRPENQRGTVGKAASYNTMLSQNQTAARRSAVNKAASHNGYFEPLPDAQSPPELHPSQARINNGSSRRNKMDPLETPRNALPPPNHVQQRGVPSSSSRRRSLEHVPSQSFRSNSHDNRYATTTNQRQYQLSHQNNGDYDYEDDNNYLGVREGIPPNMNISHRRMSAGYLPPPPATKRSVSRRGNSMDLTVNDIVHDEGNEHLNDISFSDLAARRF